MDCPECKSKNTMKFGKTVRKDGWFQRYMCKDCRLTFVGDKLED